MKKALLFLVCCLGMVGGSAQGVNWQWARSASSNGGMGISEGLAVCNDINGNAYITGWFAQRSITFGNIALNNTDTSGLTGDNYIAKYDPAGNTVWAKIITGNSREFVNNMCGDRLGNVYLVGGFIGYSVSFDTITVINPDTSNNQQAVFLAKYDSTGNVLWAKRAGGKATDFATGIAADKLGNVFITGEFNGSTIAFDNVVVKNADSIYGGRDIFIAKYDALGNIQWAKSAGGKVTDDAACSVATDTLGNAVITGYLHSDTVSFGNFSLTKSLNSIDFFIAKYDASGNALWAKISKGNNFDKGMGVTTDAAGNIFATGYFNSDSIDFDSTLLRHVVSPDTNTSDFFIVKYTDAGQLLWAKSGGGPDTDVGWNIAADMQGNAYVTGGFNSTSITFENLTLNVPYIPAITDPLFLLKYDGNGNIVCSQALLSGGDDWCGVSVDRFDNVYISGDFIPHTFIVGADTLIGTGEESIFTAKFNCRKTTSNNELAIIDLPFSLSPNPTTDQLHISIDESLVGEQLNIYNTTGALLQSVLLETNNTQLSTNNLPAGIYIAEIKTKEVSIKKRWVKM